MNWYPNAFWDTFPQELLAICPESLMDSEIFRFHFKKKVNNEFFTKDGKKLIADSPFYTIEKLIISLEFQSYRISYEKETIFNKYQADLHKEHQQRVFTVVLSNYHYEHHLIRHKIGLIDDFTMLIVSLIALNQKQTLNSSLYKINNKHNMSDKEKALFLLSPLMFSDNKIEAIRLLMGYFHKINNLSEKEKSETMNIILIYAKQWYFKEEVNNNGGGDMVVLPPDVQEFKDKLIEEALEQWLEQLISAVEMVNDGFSLDEVSEANGLSKDKINRLCGSK